MKYSMLNFFTTLAMAIILAQFLPWWSVMIAAAVSALIFPLKGWMVFLIPFIAIASYWMVYALILTQVNDFILSKKIGVLLSVGDNWLIVLLITGITGGLAAGISAIFGKQLQIVLGKNKKIGL